MTDRIQFVSAASAAEFLTHLDVTNGLFGTYYNPGGWIFRGVADAERYVLVPSALRATAAFLDMQVGWISTVQPTNRRQLAAEASTVAYFLGLADHMGFPIPEDSQGLRRKLVEIIYGVRDGSLDKAFRSGTLIWPPPELVGVVALAQHYGLCTRLLDWSHSAETAAYFAVQNMVLAQPRENQRLAVWALSTLNLRFDWLFGQTKSAEVRVFQTPYASNQNLRAQRGVFTIWTPPRMELDHEVDSSPLDVVLDAPEFAEQSSVVLYQVSLPAEHAPELLRLLAKRGVHAASVFPGLGGVVRALKERAGFTPYADWLESFDDERFVGQKGPRHTI